MKRPKRVECDKCTQFIEPEFKDYYNIKARAKCKLGKRVMFRQPVPLHASSYMAQDWGGYFRYCNDFKLIEKP